MHIYSYVNDFNKMISSTNCLFYVMITVNNFHLQTQTDNK